MELMQKIRRRMDILRALRDFFETEGHLEVDTPLLAPRLIPESHLEAFQTRYHHPGGRDIDLFLVPSPELWMKRLLACGSGSLFQICRCFRNLESLGEQHNPEFTMLEWYTVEADYLDSISRTERLFVHLRRALGLPERIVYQGLELCLEPPFERLTMEEAFRRLAGVELAECLTSERLREAARRRGVPFSPEDPWDDLFHRLFLTLVEPALPRDRPLILMDYPSRVPTLARRRGRSMFAERWELYAGGLELANCYTEETDPGRLREFIRSEGTRKRGCRVPHPPDLEMAGLFEPGFPAYSGVAMGVDRLAMLLMNQKNIDGVIFFPCSDTMRDKVPPRDTEETSKRGQL